MLSRYVDSGSNKHYKTEGVLVCSTLVTTIYTYFVDYGSASVLVK